MCDQIENKTTWSVSIPSNGYTLWMCNSNWLCSAIAFRKHHPSACYRGRKKNRIIKINLLLHAFPVVTAKERNVISIAFRHRSVHDGHNCWGTTGQWSWWHVLTLLNIIIIIIYLMIIVYYLFIIYLFIIYLLFI